MVPFSDYVALLGALLDRRREIAARIERTLLNVRGKPISQSRDRRQFDRLLLTCVFETPGVARETAAMPAQLVAAHVAAGFEPVRLDRYAHELDPLELIPRAYDYWDRHRWPGASGRLTYAQAIFAVFILRQLELLGLRVWDDGRDAAERRLDDVQRLLDRLNEPAGTTVFVTDARWLVQTAQGPLTRHLQPYFAVADHIAGSFALETRLGLHAAAARLAGGHLRSQIRYRVWNTGKPIDDPELLAFTRLSNSMDTALLVRDLVPLLDAYRAARAGSDDARRRDLADATLQGLSAEPELLLTRLDLLPSCTLVEELSIDGDRLTPMGAAHLALLERYGASIGELAEPLREDAAAIDPARHAYSPFGVSYGFCADLFNNVAMSVLVGAPDSGAGPAGIEQMFVSGGDAEGTLARANRWHALPTRGGEREHFDHSPEWAGLIFAKLVDGLDARAAAPDRANASGMPAGAIVVFPGAAPDGMPTAQEHCFTTDMHLAMTSGATPRAAADIVSDRSEGRFLASAETGGQWFGVSKLITTLFTSQGMDAVITHVPESIVHRLRLACPGIEVRS